MGKSVRSILYEISPTYSAFSELTEIGSLEKEDVMEDIQTAVTKLKENQKVYSEQEFKLTKVLDDENNQIKEHEEKVQGAEKSLKNLKLETSKVITTNNNRYFFTLGSWNNSYIIWVITLTGIGIGIFYTVGGFSWLNSFIRVREPLQLPDVVIRQADGNVINIPVNEIDIIKTNVTETHSNNWLLGHKSTKITTTEINLLNENK